MPWLTLVLVLLLSSSSILGESTEPVSNAVGSLDAASPVADARNGLPTNRLPLPNRAAAVTLWNDRALELCVKYRRNPLRVARALAVLHVAIYDAVAAAKNGAEQAQAVAAATVAGAVQKRIAEEWNLDRGSVTPAGVWNLKARNLIEAGDLDMLRTAQVLAVLNMAMADAAVASWRTKFTHWTQRPVTAIRERFDPAWFSLILTPPFPSYVSTHATVSGAAAEVLAAFFPEAAGPLQAAAGEAAMSRLYAGIHFRSDNDAGLELGRRIGRLVLERKYGQP